MLAETKHTSLRLAAAVLLVLTLLTACVSKSAQAQEKIDLGQKYLTELNYTEAVASFTEAIELDPDSIPAYMGRAEAHVGLAQYPEAKADYTTAIEKAADQPYTQAQAYVGRAEVNELTAANEDALRDYEAASNALDKVDPEKDSSIAANLLEALREKIRAAIARLKALFGTAEEPGNAAGSMAAREYPTTAAVEKTLQRINAARAEKGWPEVELIPIAECAEIAHEEANIMEQLSMDQITQEEADALFQENADRYDQIRARFQSGLCGMTLEAEKRQWPNMDESTEQTMESMAVEDMTEETKYVAIGFSDSGDYVSISAFWNGN